MAAENLAEKTVGERRSRMSAARRYPPHHLLRVALRVLVLYLAEVVARVVVLTTPNALAVTWVP
jgi:hypothetical protein